MVYYVCCGYGCGRAAPMATPMAMPPQAEATPEFGDDRGTVARLRAASAMCLLSSRHFRAAADAFLRVPAGGLGAGRAGDAGAGPAAGSSGSAGASAGGGAGAG